MFGRASILLVLVGCATARQEPRENGDVDAAVQTIADAPRTVDATSGATCTSAMSGVIATYSFAGATGNQLQTVAQSSATGMLADPIMRSAGLTAVSGATSINSSNWPLTTQLDPAKYYTLKLTPPAGCKLTLTSAAIDAKASSTGPTLASVATSADNFAALVSLATAAPSTPALAVTDASTAVEIRIYGHGASAAAGTFRLQNTVTISGSLH